VLCTVPLPTSRSGLAEPMVDRGPETAGSSSFPTGRSGLATLIERKGEKMARSRYRKRKKKKGMKEVLPRVNNRKQSTLHFYLSGDARR